MPLLPATWPLANLWRVFGGCHNDPGLTYLNGTLPFVGGLAMVHAHNVWMRAWPVLLALVGSLAMLLYLKRGGSIEAVFGQARQRGAGRFRRRALKACNSEWRFDHAVHNLLKIRTFGQVDEAGSTAVSEITFTEGLSPLGASLPLPSELSLSISATRSQPPLFVPPMASSSQIRICLPVIPP